MGDWSPRLAPCAGLLLALVAGHAGAGVNLLRNAGFRAATSGGLPDYWGLHHSALLALAEPRDSYALEPDVAPPLPEVRVLRLTNRNPGYAYLTLAATRLSGPPEPGVYTFSVYLRATGPGRVAEFAPAWGAGPAVDLGQVGDRWQRLSATFRVGAGPGGTTVPALQPVLRFPAAGSYFVAAPQLERGAAATAFEDGVADAPDPGDLSGTLAPATLPLLRAEAGFDRYLPGTTVDVRVESRAVGARTFRLRCGSGPRPCPPAATAAASGATTASLALRLPPTGPGSYTLQLDALGDDGVLATVEVPVRVVAAPTVVSRLDRASRQLEVDGRPFAIRGMAVGNWSLPGPGYFHDLASAGINTVFCLSPPGTGADRDRWLDAFIDRAGRAGLKVVVGPAAAGLRPDDWPRHRADFLATVRRYAADRRVIAWYGIDEPAADSWADADLREFYAAITALDDRRVIFTNWAYDGVPADASREPRGTLAATDIYSFSDYPFAVYGGGLPRYARSLERVAARASGAGDAAHAWIQLYSGFDAWREPAPAELRGMVFLGLVHGAMYSYWESGTPSPSGWAALAAVNRDAEQVTTTLAGAVASPPMSGAGFAWRRYRGASGDYLLVVRTEPREADFLLPGVADGSRVRPLLSAGRAAATTPDGVVARFGPYEAELFVVAAP